MTDKDADYVCTTMNYATRSLLSDVQVSSVITLPATVGRVWMFAICKKKMPLGSCEMYL